MSDWDLGALTTLGEMMQDDLTSVVLDACDQAWVKCEEMGVSYDVLCIVAPPSVLWLLSSTIPEERRANLELRADFVRDVFVLPRSELVKSYEDKDCDMPKLWMWE